MAHLATVDEFPQWNLQTSSQGIKWDKLKLEEDKELPDTYLTSLSPPDLPHQTISPPCQGIGGWGHGVSLYASEGLERDTTQYSSRLLAQSKPCINCARLLAVIAFFGCPVIGASARLWGHRDKPLADRRVRQELGTLGSGALEECLSYHWHPHKMEADTWSL